MKPQRRPFLQIGVPLTVLALMTFGASITRGQTEVAQSEAAGPLVRWDIVHFVTFTPPTTEAGGPASAKANDDSRITLTGTGTFLASGESFQAVTGGGNWTTYAPNGTTVTDRLSVSLSGPPAPVLPWSFVVTVRLAGPLRSAAGWNISPSNAVLTSASVPVNVSVESARPSPVPASAPWWRP